MNVGGLQNEMRKQALLAMRGQGRPRLGLVTDFDPSSWAAKVLIQPEGFETGFLPFMTPWVGNGWGMFTPPSQNDQVLVLYQEGHIETGLILGGFFSDVDRPLPVPQGEAWLVHQSGAFVKLTNDPELTLGDGQGATITLANGQINSSGTWVHTGAFTAVGEVNLGSASPSEPVELANGSPATMVNAV